MRDLKNNIDASPSLSPAVYSTNQAENGSGVDVQGFDAVALVFQTGAITDGTFTPKVQESEDNSAWSDVSASELEGTLNVLTANAVQRVGYKGSKRYLRPVVTVSGATSGGAVAAMVVRAMPHIAPAA